MRRIGGNIAHHGKGSSRMKPAWQAGLQQAVRRGGDGIVIADRQAVEAVKGVLGQK